MNYLDYLTLLHFSVTGTVLLSVGRSCWPWAGSFMTRCRAALRVFLREFLCLLVFVWVIPSHRLLLNLILSPPRCPGRHLLLEGQGVLALALSELPSVDARYLFIFPLFCGVCNLVCYFLSCDQEVRDMERYLLSFICPIVTNCSAQNNFL